MIIEQYGITLKRLQKEDIELVRKWRNHPKIQKNMEFKKHITQHQQEIWFDSIDNRYNYYFLIEHQGNSIGLINSKNINLSDNSGEGGLFIWEENLEQEYIPIFASLCLLNTAFYTLKIFDKSYVQILSSNTRSINYNLALGYVLLPGQEHLENRYYLLTKSSYEIKAAKLNKIAQKLTGDYNGPRIYGTPSDKNLDVMNSVLLKH